MAEFDSPIRHEDHYIERDSSSGGVWAAIIVLAVILLLLLFGTRLFSGTNNPSPNNDTNLNGSGSVNTPSGGYQGSGTVNMQ